MKAHPEKSDRQIAAELDASPTTVGKVRAEKEAAGDVSTVDTRTDTKGRRQRAHKPAHKAPPKPPLADPAKPGHVGVTPISFAQVLEAKVGDPPLPDFCDSPEAARLRADNDQLRAEIARKDTTIRRLEAEIADKDRAIEALRKANDLLTEAAGDRFRRVGMLDAPPTDDEMEIPAPLRRSPG